MQTAVVALSFLSTDNDACALEIYNAGCLPLLVRSGPRAVPFPWTGQPLNSIPWLPIVRLHRVS